MKRTNEIIFKQEELQSYGIKDYYIYKSLTSGYEDFHNLTEDFTKISSKYPYSLTYMQLLSSFKILSKEQEPLDLPSFFNKIDISLKNLEIFQEIKKMPNLKLEKSFSDKRISNENDNNFDFTQIKNQKIQETIKEDIDFLQISNNTTIQDINNTFASNIVTHEEEKIEKKEWKDYVFIFLIIFTNFIFKEVEVLLDILKEVRPKYIKISQEKKLFFSIFEEFQKQILKKHQKSDKNQFDIKNKIKDDVKRLCEMNRMKNKKVQEYCKIKFF